MMKKIHLSNFRKKNGDIAYKTILEALSKSSMSATEINVAKISEVIKDPVLNQKFKNWSSGYDFAILN